MGAPAEPPTEWLISYGGRLYDNWAAAQGKNLPEATHTAYPASGSREGSTTWRCKECHGFDGQAMNFRSEESPEYLGTVAAEDPTELLHKIRHGNPGAVMPAYLVFGMDIITDIAAYAQTLPAE